MKPQNRLNRNDTVIWAGRGVKSVESQGRHWWKMDYLSNVLRKGGRKQTETKRLSYSERVGICPSIWGRYASAQTAPLMGFLLYLRVPLLLAGMTNLKMRLKQSSPGDSCGLCCDLSHTVGQTMTRSQLCMQACKSFVTVCSLLLHPWSTETESWSQRKKKLLEVPMNDIQ